ncbi:MAG: GNAT family N-acetyltransferase [Gemmatimonadaceae bacterium]
MHIRPATFTDADILAALLIDYLHESYEGKGGSTPEQLRRDVLGDHPRHHVLLAESGGQAIGFVAWDAVYDLQWAASGAQVADLYVTTAARGLGVALELITAVCAIVAQDGGVFLRGGAYDRPSTRAAYGRVAVVHPVSGETHLSARAFQQMASLAGRPAREILRELPPVEWNFSN